MDTIAWPAAFLCCVLVTVLVWFWGRRQVSAARQVADAALATQEATLRLLRLSSTDQHNLALGLFGHVTAMGQADGALAGLARRLLDMSDTLTQQTETPAAARFLAEEEMGLMSVVRFSVEQVAAHLGPGRRAWRVDPAFDRIRLRADRRALNQVLVNVLSGAAVSTRDGDWIEIGADAGVGGWEIVIQDEGIGLPVDRNDIHPEESRGIGLRLTLARSLMQAHGGSLIVESAARVGTRVRLGFPVERVTVEPPAEATTTRSSTADMPDRFPEAGLALVTR